METISDIVREMRESGEVARGGAITVHAKTLADRIEAAHKREPVTDCNALFTNSAENENSEKVIYNNEKMREALEFAAHHLIAAMEDDELGGNILYLAGCMGVVAKKCRAALAEPRRNCDVGTAEEQEVRFTEFCDAHKYVGDDGANVCSRDCPFYNKIDCGVWWAQMPYEEGGAE